MKTRLLLPLLCSLGLNVALAALIGQDLHRPAGGQPAPDGFDSRAAAAYAAESAGESRGSAASAPQSRAPAEAERAGALARLEDELLAAAREAARGYWRTGEPYELAYAAAVLDGQDRIRGELIAAYGPAARSDRAFSRLFRPLDPLYSFLSSEQQLAVQRLRFERQRLLQSAGGGGAAEQRSAAAAAAARNAATRYLQALEALLEPATLFEFLLRDSMLAEQLRASGVELSEAEFRQAFALLQDFEQSGADIGAVLAAREALRQLLGSRRFSALWAMRDPFHARLEAAAARHELDAATLDAAYELTVEFQDATLGAVARAGNDPERAAAEVARLAAEERGRLARIVGEAAAADMLEARAVESFRLFNGSME